MPKSRLPYPPEFRPLRYAYAGAPKNRARDWKSSASDPFRSCLPELSCLRGQCQPEGWNCFTAGSQASPLFCRDHGP